MNAVNDGKKIGRARNNVVRNGSDLSFITP